MNASRQHSTSLWMARSGHDPIFEAERLAADARAEVVVVGAGIAGLSTAYELASEGRSVILIDRGRLAGGMTARTSAHLASELDDYYCEHIDMRGLEEAKALYASQAAAIDRIEEIVASERIACNFQRIEGYLYAPLGPTRTFSPAKCRAAPASDSPVSAGLKARLYRAWPLAAVCDFPARGASIRCAIALA